MLMQKERFQVLSSGKSLFHQQGTCPHFSLLAVWRNKNNLHLWVEDWAICIER